MTSHDEQEAQWERTLVCELIKAHQSKVNILGEREWSGERKYKYYRASWHLEEAVKMLRSMNESHESRVIEVSK